MGKWWQVQVPLTVLICQKHFLRYDHPMFRGILKWGSRQINLNTNK